MMEVMAREGARGATLSRACRDKKGRLKRERATRRIQSPGSQGRRGQVSGMMTGNRIICNGEI